MERGPLVDADAVSVLDDEYERDAEGEDVWIELHPMRPDRIRELLGLR